MNAPVEQVDREATSGPDRVARVTARLQLAGKHEALALELAEHVDRGSVTKAAAHFTVADALRARARSA